MNKLLNSDTPWILIIFLIGLVTGIATGIVGGGMLNPINEYQTLNELRADYERCKADTLPEFDCVLVTMAVSKDFAERQ